MSALSETEVQEVVARYADRTGDILSILEELQKRHPNRYLPKETLELVARKTGVALSQVFGVATFYSFFNLTPQPLHTVLVCRGTACHTRGSKALLEELRKLADPSVGEHAESFVTRDARFMVRSMACYGQCALAPVIGIDDRIYGKVTTLELDGLIESVDA